MYYHRVIYTYIHNLDRQIGKGNVVFEQLALEWTVDSTIGHGCNHATG